MSLFFIRLGLKEEPLIWKKQKHTKLSVQIYLSYNLLLGTEECYNELLQKYKEIVLHDRKESTLENENVLHDKDTELSMN